MKSALIITSLINDAARIRPDLLRAPYDMVICCDAGTDRAFELGIKPDIIIGDFDSSCIISPPDDDEPSYENDLSENESSDDATADDELSDDTTVDDKPGDDKPDVEMPEIVVLPHEKDMTDTEAACDLAYKRGAGVMTIVGGLGGRLDHTMANISLMSKYLGKADIFIVDGDNFVRMLAPGSYNIIQAGYTYLGLIAYGGPVTGLTESGTLYTLDDYTLEPNTSLAVSNEIVNEPARISFKTGQLLVIQSNTV